MKNNILSALSLALVSSLLFGFAFMNPDSASGPTNNSTSHLITPSQARYMFAASTSSQSDVIALRVTPLNGDPEIKKYCHYATSCQMDLSGYNFDTSSDYYIFAGSTQSGYFLFEPQ